MNKKGQISLKNAPALVLSLALIAMITAAASLAMSSFSKTTCDGYWDGSHCWTDANANVSSMGYVNNITDQGQVSLENFSNQLGTIGTIVGVTLIIGVVILSFTLFLRKDRGL